MVEQPAGRSKFSLFNMEKNSKTKLWQESPNSHNSRNGHFKRQIGDRKREGLWNMGGQGSEVGSTKKESS